MMNETSIKKMEELLANEEFAQKIADAGSYEKAYKLFTENGVDVSLDEFSEEIKKAELDLKNDGFICDDGEISAELLDMVSGGRSVAQAYKHFANSAYYAVRGNAPKSLFHYFAGIARCIW
ncbi:MAG: hypothetical protein IJN67_02975 [Oscillospiraceae bacterium]|nr:hypothetical protein [Oscillospiraceae bacterium]